MEPAIQLLITQSFRGREQFSNDCQAKLDLYSRVTKYNTAVSRFEDKLPPRAVLQAARAIEGRRYPNHHSVHPRRYHYIATTGLRPGLLDIPRELRDKILRFVLVEPNLLYAIHPMTAESDRIEFASLVPEFHKYQITVDRALLDTQVLRVNKQLFAESQEILLKDNVFEFSPLRMQILSLAPHIVFNKASFGYSGRNLETFVSFLHSHSGLRTLTITNILSQDYFFVHRQLSLFDIGNTLGSLKGLMIRDQVKISQTPVDSFWALAIPMFTVLLNNLEATMNAKIRSRKGRGLGDVHEQESVEYGYPTLQRPDMPPRRCTDSLPYKNS